MVIGKEHIQDTFETVKSTTDSVAEVFKLPIIIRVGKIALIVLLVSIVLIGTITLVKHFTYSKNNS